MGSFDEEFLAIPQEVIRATIRNNQKCFVLRDPKTGKLANKFILVANIEASDGGKAIVAGNERVIRARLSDAKFFYETDLKTQARRPAAEVRATSCSTRSSARRPSASKRIEQLAVELAPLVGADVEKAEARGAARQGRPAHRGGRRISRSAGADGKYYALAQGEDEPSPRPSRSTTSR